MDAVIDTSEEALGVLGEAHAVSARSTMRAKLVRSILCCTPCPISG